MLIHNCVRQINANSSREFSPTTPLILALSLTLLASIACSEEVVYDNTHLSHNLELFLPPPFANFHAQPFELGDNDSVSLVELVLGKQTLGSPLSGTIHVSIWDDNGRGLPGQQVGELGIIEITNLTDFGPPASRDWVLDTIVFDSLVTGLTPRETYFVVEDMSNVIGRNDRDGRPGNITSTLHPFLSRNEGTFDADRLIVADGQPENWYTIPGAGRRHMQMSVTATLTRTEGDFDDDSQLTANDIDLLAAGLRNPPIDSAFDANGDGVVSVNDHAYWVHSLANTYFGDANLDGEFNSSDMTLVFSAAEYEDNITLNSTWAEGDWNGDGDFDSSDLILAFQDGGYEQGPRADVQAVPEPACVTRMLICLPLALASVRRSRRRHA